MMLCCVTILPYASPVILDILGSGERPRFLPANGDRQVHGDQNIPANAFVFIPQRARGQQNVCSVLFWIFSRMATVHEFNRGSFLQIVLELIDDYVCNLK